MIKNRFDVLIVGTGAAATATAIRLMQFACEPLSVVAVERFPQRGNGGLAYGGPGTTWHNIYNIQAGRLSIFREDVDDFLNWANGEADRQGWPDFWAKTTFTVSGPAPRSIYADYLAERLEQAVREAPEGTTYRKEVGEVWDLVPSSEDDQVIAHVNVQEGTGELLDRKIYARQVVIATGNEFRRLPFTQHCHQHSSFIRLQYSQDGYARLQQVRANDRVVIIGSALSGYDAALALSKDLGHRGPVYMFSRHGVALQAYPSDHRHDVITVRRPPFLDHDYCGPDKLIEDVVGEWEYLCSWLASEHPHIPPSIYSERVLKAWEPYIVELVAKIPPSDANHLLQNYNTLISNMRVCAMPYAIEAMAELDLTMITAHIDDIVANETGGLTICYSDEAGAQSLDADLVVANLNRESDYAQVKNPLWRNLIDRQELAVPHKATGRGVEVGPSGELVSASGKVSNRLRAVGLPREGDEIARNGRLGAFAFNIATLKNHSIATALRVVSILEGGSADTAGDACGNPQASIGDCVPAEARQGFAALFGKAAGLKVHWLSARRRADKQTIQAKLELLEQEICQILAQSPLSAEERLNRLRAALTDEALRRMTDVSVTPLELRQRLGLDTAPLRETARTGAS